MTGDYSKFWRILIFGFASSLVSFIGLNKSRPPPSGKVVVRWMSSFRASVKKSTLAYFFDPTVLRCMSLLRVDNGFCMPFGHL